MAKWRIDTLTPQEIAKYRQRSFDAINGIEYLLKYANVIAQYEKISDKYKTIAEYIGLGQEGGNSFYNYFIPLNADIVFLLRNSNHNNTNPYLYNRHEQLGRPNKRYIVYFKNGNTFSDNPITLLDAEHHSISYDVNALDNETSVIAYLNSLKGLFENGETTFQPLPITTENKQYNKNTNMKQTIKLSESELKRVIAESVKRVINEVWDIDDNGVIDYDDDFGYDFIEGNEDTPRSVRKNQMNADFENNRTPKPYNSKYYYDDFNMNTYDFNGDLGMKALKGDKFAKTLRRNTPQGWVDAAKDSKID